MNTQTSLFHMRWGHAHTNLWTGVDGGRCWKQVSVSSWEWSGEVTPVSQIGEFMRVSKGKGPDPLSEAGLGKQDRRLGREFVGRSLRRMRSCELLGLKFKGLTGAQVQWGKRGTNKLRESIGWRPGYHVKSQDTLVEGGQFESKETSRWWSFIYKDFRQRLVPSAVVWYMAMGVIWW